MSTTDWLYIVFVHQTFFNNTPKNRYRHIQTQCTCLKLGGHQVEAHKNSDIIINKTDGGVAGGIEESTVDREFVVK